MKRLFLSILCFTCGILMALAVPAKDVRIEVQQPDSTTLVICLRGDEHCHGYYTEDGVRVVKNAGAWYYAMVSDGRIVASQVLAHSEGRRSVSEAAFCTAHATEVQNIIRQLWEEDVITGMSPAESMAKGAGAYDCHTTSAIVGKKRGLVILVQFADVAMKTTNPQQEFLQQFNLEGYSKNNHVGSVHDYFYDQSYGKLDITFDVVGPYTVSNDYDYYGENATDDSGRKDMHAAEMVIEACRLADADVDFSDYDWDGNGELDQVFVIFAGYPESSGASESTIWPHESYLSSRAQYYDDGTGTLTLDGVTIDKYACSSELAGNSGTTINGIGTACHEFSHCLGFPDFYDTTYSGGPGMKQWDLLSSGSYNGPNGIGEVPAGYTAYERWQAGWLEPTVLSEPVVVTSMPCLGDSARAYIIYNDNNKNEYFLLENRQPKRWFSYMEGFTAPSGLLITHVDYNAAAWSYNMVNTNVSHQRYTYVPADKNYLNSKDGYYGDLFPGSGNVTAFADGTHSSANGNLFNPNTDSSVYLHKPVENITEQNGLISFYFMGGNTVSAPQDIVVSDISDNSFSVGWGSVTGADSYTLELSTLSEKVPPSQNLLLSENFSKFKAINTKTDGFTDLSSKLDSYTTVSGWAGYKVFNSPNGVKIGTSSVDGYIITPAVSTKDGKITVRMSVAACNSSSVSMTISALDMSAKSVTETACFIGKSFTDKIFVLSGLTSGASYKVKVTAAERIYIGNLYVYNGEYEAADFESDASYGMSVSDVKTVTGITDTDYTFSGLTGEQYRVRLCANKDVATSDWSDSATVDLNGYTAGDCNNDGKVDKNDASMIVRYYVGSHHKPMILDAADVTGDGKATVADANKIVNVSLGR